MTMTEDQIERHVEKVTDFFDGCFRPRFGDTFTGIRGVTFYNSMKEAKTHLKACGLAIGKKTDTRTWEIVTA